MTASAEVSAATAGKPAWRSRIWARLALMPLAAIAAVVASNNWCWVLFPAMLAAGVLDIMVCRLTARRMARLAVAVAVGAALGLLLNVGPSWAFRETFGIEPPPGVGDVQLSRHYTGGPGEHALILEFHADPAALQCLIGLRPADPQSPRVAQWRAAGSGWTAAWEAFGGCWNPNPLARRSWLGIRPLENPEVLDFGNVFATGGALVLFHEPAHGRCVALHVRF